MLRGLLRWAPLAACAALLGLPVPSRADVRPWKANAAPMAWNAARNEVLYNRRGADGLWDAYRAAPDGTGEKCLTCTVPAFPQVGAATHRGVSDVSPDGRYLLLDVERGSHFGRTGAPEAEPGRGAYSDVWLATADGSQAWPLTDIYAPGATAIGTIWPRFDRTGNRIVWAQMDAPAIVSLGAWSLKLATLEWQNGVPRLADVRTYRPEPNRFFEPYGFSPDNRRILFASDTGMPNWWVSQIYAVSTDFTDLRRMSPADVAPGFFSNYNEFAFYEPAGDRIVYSRTVDAGGGMDYWTMRADGQDQRRLTFMNEAWNTEGRGLSIAGGLAFDPHDPNRFVAGVATDSLANNINAVMVDATPAEAGLRAEYFKDPSLRQPAVSRIENPGDGFKWSGAPAPGVPADRFSVRWSGSVTAPLSGRYTYCVFADDGARLWVGGRLLIDAWNTWPGRRCGAVSEQAGHPDALRLEYWDRGGTGEIQLTTSAPNATAQQALPAARLSPTAAPTPAALAASRVAVQPSPPPSAHAAPAASAPRARSGHRRLHGKTRPTKRHRRRGRPRQRTGAPTGRRTPTRRPGPGRSRGARLRMR